MKPITIPQLAETLGLTLPAGQVDTRQLSGVRPLETAGPEHLSFLDNPAYRKGAESTKAGAVLIRQEDASLLPSGTTPLITPQPYVAFARALALFHPQPEVAPGVSAQAVVSASATIHPTARVEPGAVIYAGATIGAGAHIGAHTVIGENCTIGTNTRIAPHCTLLKTKIGNNCIIHSGVRTGQDGFGFAVEGANLIKVPQVGNVVIGNDVEIGANTTIDCGALGDTIIEDMVKIDNQVQIAHNVKVGRATRIVAQAGVAGSAELGAFNVIGGQVGLAGHIKLADKVMVAARSGVSKSIPTPGMVVAGVPAEPILNWKRKVALLSRLLKQHTKTNPEPKDSDDDA